jgi:hypothetical protein
VIVRLFAEAATVLAQIRVRRRLWPKPVGATSLVPSSAMSDPELTAVRRPFDAALLRMCQAGDVDLLRDELSNMLHHMYRLGELCARRWQLKGDHAGFNAKVAKVAGALGALWIRTFDTHEIASISTTGDVYSDFYTELDGVAVWKPVAAMPLCEKAFNRLGRRPLQRLSRS